MKYENSNKNLACWNDKNSSDILKFLNYDSMR